MYCRNSAWLVFEIGSGFKSNRSQLFFYLFSEECDLCCLSFDMILYANRTTQNDAASFHRLLFFSKRPIGNQVPVGQSGPGCRPTRGHRTVNQGPLDGRSGASGRPTRSHRPVDQGPAAGQPGATGRSIRGQRPANQEPPAGRSGASGRPTRSHWTVDQGPSDGQSGATGRSIRGHRTVNQEPPVGRSGACGRAAGGDRAKASGRPVGAKGARPVTAAATRSFRGRRPPTQFSHIGTGAVSCLLFSFVPIAFLSHRVAPLLLLLLLLLLLPPPPPPRLVFFFLSTRWRRQVTSHDLHAPARFVCVCVCVSVVLYLFWG